MPSFVLLNQNTTKTYKYTVYNFANLTISTFRSMYKAEKQDVYFATLK